MSPHGNPPARERLPVPRWSSTGFARPRTTVPPRATIGTVDAAALVKQARRRSGLTQQVLAERAGIRRQTVALLESGTRRPSLTTLVGLLPAAGLQMRVELEPLDADVRREIDARRGQPDAASDVTRVWVGFHEMEKVVYRLEGLAAAALLGAPVPVPTVQIALADTAATNRWLVARLRDHDVSLFPDGWCSPLRVGLPADDDDGATVRALLAAECPEGWFWLQGWFDRLAAHFAPADEVGRRVFVATAEGTIAVQPLGEIESADASVARVLRVLREDATAEG
jgi:transcriptional regulator with XRE-family HTH domain